MRPTKTKNQKPPRVLLEEAVAEAHDVLLLSDPDGHRAAYFRDLPEDAEVLALCERYGFGAVMDSAARQWRQRDPIGAYTTGACPPTIKHALRLILKALGKKA